MRSGLDVTVRGAGIMGLSVAWACARRGARVRVIDPNGVATGASGGVVGALAPHAPERWTDVKAFQLEGLLMAEGWWADVARAAGRDPGYARTGRLQPIADEDGLRRARARAEAAATLWGGRASWTVTPAATFDLVPETPTGLLIHDTLSARIDPRAGCAALTRALTHHGAEIVVEGAEAGTVVHATGWTGLAALRDPAGRAAGTGVKGQAAVLRLARPDAPQVFADGLHVVPHADGTVAVGSTSERDFDAPATTDERLDDVLARARRAVPALRNVPVLTRWAGVRPRARSRGPVLGAWPGRPGHVVANGGFKIGFGIAPLGAERLADLILDGRDDIPAAFRPDLAPWDGTG